MACVSTPSRPYPNRAPTSNSVRKRHPDAVSYPPKAGPEESPATAPTKGPMSARARGGWMDSEDPDGTGEARSVSMAELRATASGGTAGRDFALQKSTSSTAFSSAESGAADTGRWPDAAAASWARLARTAAPATFRSRASMWASPWLAKSFPLQVIEVSPSTQ